YKEAFPHEKCVAIIAAESGKQFDPQLVEVFLKIEGQFREIAEQFASQSEGMEALSLTNRSTPEDVGKLTPSQEKTIKILLETEDNVAEPAAV
ncbi:MAG: hypothetical protein KDA84_07130, partial [Planctomycetaceae bacterium]|nr:hypothetical protein [Planctomycetaceae bacterium]